jgi:hypothetical protein
MTADANIKTIAQIYEAFGFRDGKIAYYRGTEDTAQTEVTLRD